jgi:hypothetical protein
VLRRDAMRAIVSEKTIEQRTRHVLTEIFSSQAREKIAVRLWNGATWPDERPRAAVLALKHPEALGRMFMPGTEVGLAEASLHNDFDIEGDIEAAFEIADFLLAHLKRLDEKVEARGTAGCASQPREFIDNSTCRDANFCHEFGASAFT